MSVMLGLVALLCLFLFFKVTSFLLRLAVIVVILGAAYWFLAPYVGWPVLHF